MRSSAANAFAEGERAFALLSMRKIIATALCCLIIFGYIFFMILCSFGKNILGIIIIPGLSIAVLFGAGLIVISFLVGIIYCFWVDRVFEPAVREIGCRGGADVC